MRYIVREGLDHRRRHEPHRGGARLEPTTASTVAVIPHTLGGDDPRAGANPAIPVNLEVDVVAKYVERLVAPFAPGILKPDPRRLPVSSDARES